MSSATCVATCTGFTTLRTECAANPCYAENLCQFDDPSITDCAEWCCKSRGGYIFFMVMFFCLGAFLALAAYYFQRLHEDNVKAGAVTKDGKRITVAPQSDTNSAAKRLRAIFRPSGEGALTTV
mmetsp:Transcript_22292/g.25811  ORF Transcript_22292/g.25811 Transcript_22292/m.25811 type:complete len:124 (+) Transcript_22292:168-539(+)|eukprot:CAMPEP_0176432390 /NCGR_PEP_ID=MMETSP0127-20121128/15368_1 /TAXON_ID=938130 /ORGANISM="Platyophrya macrostoma, Strain WH" /LENGTH=123 /DNA_ID=CAMNT_0017814557 /DNA_START=250 /DNA_END=621 /DNA_ORIENTATION=+